MDKRRSYYLHSKQDVFAEPAADANRLDFNDIPFVVPANDNLGTKDRLSAHKKLKMSCSPLLLNQRNWSINPSLG
jgi:hypothetical protein